MDLTSRYIQMLKDDDQVGLEKLYSSNEPTEKLTNIDFDKVHQEIKDIHNSSVYYVLGTFIYLWGHTSNPNISDEGKALYYLQKSVRMGNQCATKIVDTIYNEDDICSRDIFKFMDLHIDLEEKYEKLIEYNQQLEKKVKEQEDEITEMKYRPDGIGYQEALADFTKLSNYKLKFE